MNAPNPPHWTLISCFGASRCIWVHLAMFRYFTKLGAKRVELVQLMQKFVPWSRIRIFRDERTQSTPWTLNSCLCASRSVCVYLAIFCYYTKLGAKWVELVQLMHKFLPWNRIGIFSMNGPDPPHWTINSCFGASRNVWVHLAMFHYHKTLCKTGWTAAINAQDCAMKSFWNFSQRMHPTHSIRP